MTVDGEYRTAAHVDRLIEQTLHAGLEHVGRGMVLVVIDDGSADRWCVAYIGRNGINGYERELMDQYDPRHEMVVCFVGPDQRQAHTFRLPVPWRARAHTLH